jgi:hypothetical protein
MRTIDLPRARRALAKLDELARDHPEAFDPERLPTTPDALVRAMQGSRRIGRPPSPDPAVPVPLRLPRSMLATLDALVAERRCTDPGATRQDLLREGVDRYLAAEKRRDRRATIARAPRSLVERLAS